MNRKIIGMALAVIAMMLGAVITFAQSTGAGARSYAPLKMSDFFSIESYTEGEGEGAYERYYPSAGFEPKFMTAAGFTRKKGRYIREDVIVWAVPDIDNENKYGDKIYFEFTTEEAAKAFIKTCGEIEGLENDGPDEWYYRSAGPSAGIYRNGKSVVISTDYT